MGKELLYSEFDLGRQAQSPCTVYCYIVQTEAGGQTVRPFRSRSARAPHGLQLGARISNCGVFRQEIRISDQAEVAEEFGDCLIPSCIMILSLPLFVVKAFDVQLSKFLVLGFFRSKTISLAHLHPVKLFSIWAQPRCNLQSPFDSRSATRVVSKSTVCNGSEDA